MGGTGITPPFEDVSDYCLGRNGILFFEISKFNPDETRIYLESVKQHRKLSDQEVRCLGLINEFDEASEYARRFSQSIRVTDDWLDEEHFLVV